MAKNSNACAHLLLWGMQAEMHATASKASTYHT